MIDASMMPDFIVEVQEHLEKLESSLLELETGGENLEVLNEIFRAMHTIKGSAQLLGITRIAELAHKLENLLDLIRQRGGKIDQNLIDIMIDGKDRISVLAGEVDKYQEEKTLINDLRTRIHDFEKTGAETDRLPARDLIQEKPASSGLGEDEKNIFNDEIELTRDFKELFSNVDETVEEDFIDNPAIIGALSDEEPAVEKQVQNDAPTVDMPAVDPQANNEKMLPGDTDVIAALADEKPAAESGSTEEHLPDLEQKMDAFFGEATEEPPAPAAEPSYIIEKSASKPPAQPEIDIETLKSEIASEELDEELFQIFTEQLQENISLLRTLTEGFAEVSVKTRVVGQCSNLLSKLHSSANYMGYDRLTEFYGQWIAELEMTDLELSLGSQVSFDFMSANIAKITEIFPQVIDIAAEETLPGEKQETMIPLPTAPARVQENMDTALADSNTVEKRPDFKEMFISIKEADENDFTRDTVVIAALSAEGTDAEEPTAESQGDDTSIPGVPADEEPAAESDNTEDHFPDLEQKMDAFFGEATEEPPVPAAEPSYVSEKSASKPPTRPDIDIEALKSDIASEEFDEELFQIFTQQLQENISLLRTLTEGFAEASAKTRVVGQCSDLLSKLHSSANYMGYDRLTEFYGQWIAELEMTDLELSLGSQVSFDFMSANIAKIIEIFPLADDIPAEEALPDEKQEAIISPPIAPSLSEADSRRTKLLEKLSSELEALSDRTATPITEKDNKPLPSLLQDEKHDGEEVSRAWQNRPEDDQLVQIAPPAKDRKLFNKLSDALEVDDNQQLFDKLSSALESSTTIQPPSALKPIDDVINEILTGDGLARPNSSPAVPALSSPDKKSPLSPSADNVRSGTDRRKDGVDRRQHIIDRRCGREDRRLGDMAETPQKKQSIRVDADKIDFLMNQVGELVVSRSYLSQLSLEMREIEHYFKESGHLADEELKPLKEYIFKLNQANTALGRVSNEIQDGVMQVRMLPVEYLFKRYPRLVRDLIYQSGKKVNLVITGENTELDKTIIEEISDPLMHIVRNAVDHGIETVEERRKAGKEETATLRLASYHDCSNIIIEITDDGRGVDPGRIKAKALELNLFTIEELDPMSEEELVRLIMTPGFTTAEQTTTTSGRGIGLDVVKTNIDRLNGSIDIESLIGHETMIRVKIPLTLAIIQALSVRVGSKILTIPLAGIVETARIKKVDISTVEGVEITEHREAPLPLLRLAEILNIETDAAEGKHLYVVVVSAEGQRAGLVVDELMSKDEAVIKPLAEYLRKESGFSGATIRGDGTISLILDISTLLTIVKERQVTRHKKQILHRTLKGLAIA